VGALIIEAEVLLLTFISNCSFLLATGSLPVEHFFNSTGLMSAVKRTACDRCHGQKMRCIREGTRAKCNRCLAASAQCVFSIARKAGRPPASSISSKTSGQQKHPPQQQPSPAYSHRRNSCDLSSGISIFEASLLDDDDVVDASSSLFGAGVDLSDPARTSGNPPLETWSDVSMCGTDSHALWAESYQYLDVGSFELEHEHPSHIEDGLSVDTSHIHPNSEIEPEPGPGPPTAGNVKVNAMQQLSELSGRLFAHVNLSPRPPEDSTSKTIDTQTVRLEQLTARVIECSVTFRSILSSATPAFSDTATTLQILTVYIRLAQLHHTLYIHIQSVLSSEPSTITPSSNYSPSFTSNSTQSVLVAFPSLQIGGVSLSSYPRFQLKFILQICVHHLGEVEALLGLPAGFCVSEKGSDCSGGILHQDTGGTVLLVRTVMMEAEEMVKGIRRVLAELVKELRGSIQV
jgi:hypothetical protein